jgi:hypothetical protein
MDAAQALDLAREQAEAASRAGDKYAELRARQQVAAYVLILGNRDGFDRIVEEEERLQHELRIVDYWTGLHHALQAQMDGQVGKAGGSRSFLRNRGTRTPITPPRRGPSVLPPQTSGRYRMGRRSRTGDVPIPVPRCARPGLQQ